MKKRSGLILGLFVALMAFWRSGRGAGAPVAPQAPPSVETDCLTVPPDSVEGYVTNKSADYWQIDGVAQFTFSDASSYQKSIGVEVHTTVSPQERKLVVHTRPPFVLQKGEPCRFDVQGIIRKVPG